MKSVGYNPGAKLDGSHSKGSKMAGELDKFKGKDTRQRSSTE
jgi:hypothetical protein